MYFPIFFFFNDTATTEIYTLSLHDALPILKAARKLIDVDRVPVIMGTWASAVTTADRKSTRLNSSHSSISYAVFCLKKKKKVKQLAIHSRDVARALTLAFIRH